MALRETARRSERAVARALTIRGTTLRNRVVGAPMERNYCDLAGRPTDRYVAYLGARAAGGAALVFTESSYVSQDSQARPHQMGMHDDAVLPGLRRIARAVHAHGARLGVELNHAGRVVPPAVSQRQPVAPSAIACAEIGGALPRALSTEDAHAVVAQFGHAAARAVRGGADVLSIHAAHGYLIAQFLSPRSNARTDEFAAPTAFLNRVVATVRRAAGEDVPVFLRLSAFEGLPGGLDVEASLALVDEMDLEHVDVLDLSAGTYGAGQWITPSGEVDEGYLGAVAHRYKERTGKLVAVAGRITTPESAEALVASGTVDLVCAARALHADAAWSRHVVEGTQPRPCISCNQGCADVIFTGDPIWCAANPATGAEWLLRGAARTSPPRDRDRWVAVVGAGPAGMEAAAAIAEHGLRVRLFEAGDDIGGQYALAARLRAKPQFARLLSWYAERLQRLDVEVLTSVTADPAQVADARGVVLATGSTDHLPLVPGIDHERVQGIRSWLARAQSSADVGAVTVWGADRPGVFVADDLLRTGTPVTVVASQPELAPDAGAREKLPAVERLTTSPDVILHLGCTVEQIGDDAVLVSREGERSVVTAPGPILVSQGAVPVRTATAWDDLSSATLVEAVDPAAGATFDAAFRAGRASALRLVERLRTATPDLRVPA